MIAFILLQAGKQPTSEAAKKFAELDPLGIGMTVIGVSIVFLSLMLLYLTFKNIAKLYSIDYKKRFARKKVQSGELVEVVSEPTGELGAAIGMALFLYKNEMHDHENTFLTIKKVTKTYSPWSSKIYGIRKQLK